MEDSYSGENAYLILLKNPGCPIRDPTYDSGGSNLVEMNGIVYVSASYAFPFNSFLHVLENCPPIMGGFVGIIFDVDTGEGRLYDGSQGILPVTESIFWSPQQASIGKVKSFDITINKKLQVVNELGQMYPRHIHSAGLYDYTVNLNKVAIDRNKLESPDKTLPTLNQYTIFGQGLVELDEYVRQLQSDYFMCILYLKDFSGDASNFARSFVMPCTAFESVKVTSSTEKLITLTASGKPTYIKSVPFDNITSYSLAWSPLICDPVELIVENTDDTTLVVGDDGGQEWFIGQAVTTVGAMNMFAVGIWIDQIVSTPSDIIIRLYQAPNGALLGSTEPISYSDITTGVETLFYFSPTEPLAAATAYFIGIESTSGADTQFYRVQVKNNPGAGLGYLRGGGGGVWPPTNAYGIPMGAEFDIKMTLYGCEP